VDASGDPRYAWHRVQIAKCAAAYAALNAELWDGSLPLYRVVISECGGHAGHTSHDRRTVTISPRAPLRETMIHELAHVRVEMRRVQDRGAWLRVAWWAEHGGAFAAECNRLAPLIGLDPPTAAELASWPQCRVSQAS
jgi:hypothetical protein